MIPRPSYPMDSQQRAEDLAATILAASTPPQIDAACSAVDSFLLRHSSDYPRAFFSVAFPALLCRLFGFNDSSQQQLTPASSAWIDAAAADPSLASHLFKLLSPSGDLLASIAAADRVSLVKYIFPKERLPEWMRSVLHSPDRSSPSNLANLCPLLKSRIKEDEIQGTFQLQLNIFEYYIFWFAYFPVCRGNTETADSQTITKRRRFRLENWTTSLPSLTSVRRRSGQKVDTDLYLRLLYSYLCSFVPKCGVGSYQPYRSSLLHYSSSYDASAFMQAEFFVYTVVHFWMVDNDFSPLPTKMCRSFGVMFPFRSVLGKMPPTAGLAEALKLFVKYLNSSLEAPVEENNQKVFNASSSRTASPLDSGKSLTALSLYENSSGSWNFVVQRPLYRYILRTFLFCPMGTSIKNASDVLSLWVVYISPWKSSPDDFAELEKPMGNCVEMPAKDSRSQTQSVEEPSYTAAWEGYVLSNYLFFSSLFVHFLGFAHKFLNENVEMVTQMVLKVLATLTSSKELIDLLRDVDAAYHTKHLRSCLPSSSNVHKYLPSIREQLQDWEDGLCESDVDGSFLHENWNNDLKLFSESEDGAQNLLQLLVLRAEHEVQISSLDISQNLLALDSIKDQMNLLFGGSVRRSMSPILHEEGQDFRGRGEIFSPKHPSFGKRTRADVNYRGDSMRRPISDYEVAWLARLLVRVSDLLNKSLGLEGYQSESSRPIYVDLKHIKANGSAGPKEAMMMVIAHLSSWLAVLGQTLLSFMRSHGIRINLRVLAMKSCVVILVACAFFYTLIKAVHL